MSLTSLSFFAFVLATLIVYYLIPKRFRWMVLLAASGAFYAICALNCFPFIVFTSLSTWIGALWLDKYTTKRKLIQKENKGVWDSEFKKEYKHKTLINRRLILVLFLVLNFGILGVFKYYDVVAGWIANLVNGQASVLGILLPLGISFYTFQTMGYIIDVYWGKTKPEKNYAKFALFVSFFPQIIQGPIAIYDDLAHQLFEGHDLKFENIKAGFQLILWGLFKKMIIADRLVIALDTILPEKNNLGNAYSLLAVLIYMFQLYMDFSGGIDIARGVGKMLGIDMALNFKRPFFSRTAAGFWRRWHISLCNWLKTYLFYPIAVSRAFLRFGKWISSKSKSEKELLEDSLWGGFTFLQHAGRVVPGCIATLITFFVIGMWHGTNWRYAGYGLYFGILLFISVLLEPVFKKINRKLKIKTTSAGFIVWQIVRTFVIVLVSFVFDIADNLSDSISMVGKCFTPWVGAAKNPAEGFDMGLDLANWIVAIAGLVIVFIISIYQERHQDKTLSDQKPWLQWVLTLCCFTCVIIFGMYGPGVQAGEFVYMQF